MEEIQFSFHFVALAGKFFYIQNRESLIFSLYLIGSLHVNEGPSQLGEAIC